MSVQSNLGRRPRRCESTGKYPLVGYYDAPQIRPQKVPLPADRSPNPTIAYVPRGTRPTYDAKRHPDPIRRFSTMYWTARRTDMHRPTHRPTDRPRKSLTNIGRYMPLTRATWPNNTNLLLYTPAYWCTCNFFKYQTLPYNMAACIWWPRIENLVASYIWSTHYQAGLPEPDQLRFQSQNWFDKQNIDILRISHLYRIDFENLTLTHL